MIRLWCFDLNGTLVDSCADLTAAVNHMRAGLALPPLPEATVMPMLGNGMRRLTERALPDAPAGTDIDAALDCLREYYMNHSADRSRPYLGVKATLAKLRASGARLAVVTNKVAAAAQGVLDGLDLSAMFDRVIGDGEGYRLKPEPDMLLALLKEFGVPPEAAAMVGDNDTDLAAGRAAGMMRIYADYGYGGPHGETYDRVIHTFVELEHIL